MFLGQNFAKLGKMNHFALQSVFSKTFFHFKFQKNNFYAFFAHKVV